MSIAMAASIALKHVCMAWCNRFLFATRAESLTHAANGRRQFGSAMGIRFERCLSHAELVERLYEADFQQLVREAHNHFR
jgi:hypothetical protein